MCVCVCYGQLTLRFNEAVTWAQRQPTFRPTSFTAIVSTALHALFSPPRYRPQLGGKNLPLSAAAVWPQSGEQGRPLGAEVTNMLLTWTNLPLTPHHHTHTLHPLTESGGRSLGKRSSCTCCPFFSFVVFYTMHEMWCLLSVFFCLCATLERWQDSVTCVRFETKGDCWWNLRGFVAPENLPIYFRLD